MLHISPDIAGIVIVPGSAESFSVNVKQADGTAFNLTAYSVKAKVTIGSVEATITGTVTNAAGGVATIAVTAATTMNWPTGKWGTLTVYADPNTGSENIHVASISLRTAAEDIP